MIHHRLFFAEASPQWEDLGVAFIRGEQEEAAKTLGRMYLISKDQFREIVLQENGYRRMDAEVEMDLERTVREGRSKMPEGLYGTLLYLGHEDEHPIFTFTASWDENQAPLNRPGPKYLKVIIRGLKETFGLSNEGVVEYLKDIEGVRGLIPEEGLGAMVEEARG